MNYDEWKIGELFVYQPVKGPRVVWIILKVNTDGSALALYQKTNREHPFRQKKTLVSAESSSIYSVISERKRGQ